VVGATAEEDNDTNRGKGSLRGLLLKIIFLNKVFNETYWIAIQFRGVCENVLKDWFVIVFFPAAALPIRRCISSTG
jgi:hypothetical protein